MIRVSAGNWSSVDGRSTFAQTSLPSQSKRDARWLKILAPPVAVIHTYLNYPACSNCNCVFVAEQINIFFYQLNDTVDVHLFDIWRKLQIVYFSSFQFRI